MGHLDWAPICGATSQENRTKWVENQSEHLMFCPKFVQWTLWERNIANNLSIRTELMFCSSNCDVAGLDRAVERVRS